MKKISKEIREYDEWLNTKYAKREDKDNIFPVGITDSEFREWVIHNNQINEIAMEDIIFKKCGIEAKDRK